jgi:hypothetical protein
MEATHFSRRIQWASEHYPIGNALVRQAASHHPRSLYQDRLLPHLLAAAQATLIILLAVLRGAFLAPHLTRSATLACLLARSASPSRAQVEFAWKTD